MKTRTITRFEEIESWKLARKLSLEIWEISSQGAFVKDRGLYDQINRSAGSVMDNIAEGFGRGGNREFIHFLSIARASNDELRSQLYRAFDRKHLSQPLFQQLFDQSLLTGTKISKFIKYLQFSSHKGQKFKR